MSARSKKHKDPFVNGWGIVSEGSVTMHAVLFPTDIGDHDLALCETVGAWGEKGWIEPSDEVHQQALYCNPCLQKLHNLIDDGDPRITKEDEDRYFIAVLRMQKRVSDDQWQEAKKE